ncbi:MAG: hypothetical protein UV02_C0051G0005 [Candidatus Kuenenbacteria bacterium GW2011_GWA2_42_15]|uniref:Uncharacterized protein n=1 Tax=Candidatus Kuenenbacteria bacterium GW2011_GWA2_42_15 TaxID=1618677 RepID=A0A0G1B0P3_9BACT|nr:MAG: hypothetical protein UV02_C0051G0005 [Candidatus Kuenenbacteria bacterium GW2011_GWA2_42_15]
MLSAYKGRIISILRLKNTKNMKINKIVKTALVSCVIFGLATPALAVDIGLNYAAQVGLASGELRSSAVGVIQSLLGVLGILALIIVLIGGFRWMTAGGNEEKVADARKTLQAAVIGLLIILASYGIALYVFTIIEGATGQGAVV